MFPFTFRWYVSVEQFNLFGKIRVLPIVWPENLEVGGRKLLVLVFPLMSRPVLGLG